MQFFNVLCNFLKYMTSKQLRLWMEIKVVKILKELAELEPKAHLKHQRETRTNIT